MTERKPIVAVCGLPRSGTSLVMQMLVAGGMDAHFDAGKGFPAYETADVFRLPSDPSWLETCRGKAVKILEPQAHPLDPKMTYKVIFLSRSLREQAKSLKKLVAWGGVAMPPVPTSALAQSLRNDLHLALGVLRDLHDAEILTLRFVDLVRHPAIGAERIAEFLSEFSLSSLAMRRAVEPRTSDDCLSYMLEERLVESHERGLATLRSEHAMQKTGLSFAEFAANYASLTDADLQLSENFLSFAPESSDRAEQRLLDRTHGADVCNAVLLCRTARIWMQENRP